MIKGTKLKDIKGFKQKIHSNPDIQEGYDNAGEKELVVDTKKIEKIIVDTIGIEHIYSDYTKDIVRRHSKESAQAIAKAFPVKVVEK